LERGGSEETRGVPAAFIESAWRRYTKHSKNKVREIEAAVMPVTLTFSRHQPFLGAVLAGEFTRSALDQLESKGFAVLHVPYNSIVTAFTELGIDASSKDGVFGTTEEQFREKIEMWESLPQPQSTENLLTKIHALHERQIMRFVERLDAAITRRVNSVQLTVLHGHSVECPDIESAIAYLIEEEKSYRLRETGEQREGFEVQVRGSGPVQHRRKDRRDFPQTLRGDRFLTQLYISRIIGSRRRAAPAATLWETENAWSQDGG
jgi:hypothetical protein